MQEIITNAQTGEVTVRDFTPEEIAAWEAAQAAATEAARASMTLSFAQLLIGLVTEGWITEAEGDAWAEGTLPAAVLAVISTLPANQKFAARTRARRPSEIVRNDPLVIALGTAQGKTAEQLDQFFVTYSQI